MFVLRLQEEAVCTRASRVHIWAHALRAMDQENWNNQETLSTIIVANGDTLLCKKTLFISFVRKSQKRNANFIANEKLEDLHQF